MINNINIEQMSLKYKNAKPFNYIVIDNFFKEGIANKIEKEISSIDVLDESTQKDLFIYSTDIEKVVVCNRYDSFKENTYQAFSYLNSSSFLNIVEKITNISPLIADSGLHGGGLLLYPTGGKLNVHQDYSIHPKLKKERRLTFIVYMNLDWQKEWGGHLELYSHDEKTNKPKEVVETISMKFNRAIIFDTTQNSWHGFPKEIKNPKNINRQSLATFYLTEPRKETRNRDRALFTTTKEQESDQNILDLIEKRSDSKTSSAAYRDEKVWFKTT